ncbi:MAG: hypothetical protein RSC93_07295 [Erysipelotrichaceae bacterium]
MSAIKSREFNRATMSEMFGKLQYRDCNVKERYGERGKFDYLVKVLQDDTDEIFEVVVANEPLDIKKGDIVDFNNFLYKVRAKGTGAFGTNIQAELAETFSAERCSKSFGKEGKQ